ncbi:putative beta-14-xylosyltransferase IRX14 [Zea mays]|uniref:Glycosyltransferases n=1 Tax=Zea mays TaxID=4577 RepID=A0A1D6MEN5_MAIZE|nr:putative beta-14-xylosyltransferase IRX14 [Zea mays]
MPLPVHGPACNSSGHLIGWHTFNSLPFSGKTATVVGEAAPVLPRDLEWAGFVLNSRMLWKEADDKPDWVKDLDAVGENGEEIENPLTLLNDPSSVEPLGNCGKNVLLWWLRVEALLIASFLKGEFFYIPSFCYLAMLLGKFIFVRFKIQTSRLIPHLVIS